MATTSEDDQIARIEHARFNRGYMAAKEGNPPTEANEAYQRGYMAGTPVSTLRALVLEWFQVYDRPCLQNGSWPYVQEYRAIDAKLREIVGAPPWKER